MAGECCDSCGCAESSLLDGRCVDEGWCRGRVVMLEEELPMSLCPDPQLGTRFGWLWCADCQGIKPPEHHHDEFSVMSEEQLRAWCRWKVRAEAIRYGEASAIMSVLSETVDQRRK